MAKRNRKPKSEDLFAPPSQEELGGESDLFAPPSQEEMVFPVDATGRKAEDAPSAPSLSEQGRSLVDILTECR